MLHAVKKGSMGPRASLWLVICMLLLVTAVTQSREATVPAETEPLHSLEVGTAIHRLHADQVLDVSLQPDAMLM